MFESFSFTAPGRLEPLAQRYFAVDMRADVQRLREVFPQLKAWPSEELAEAWGDFSRDLRGLSWCDPNPIEGPQFLAFLMVVQLFPHVNPWTIGYEAFKQLGGDEPWVTWPDVKWPAWVLDT